MRHAESSLDRFLIVKGSGSAGLGDKLRALISAIVYARLTGRILYVDWNDSAYGDGVNNYFSDLFTLTGVRTTSTRPQSDSVRPAAWQGSLHLNWDQLYEEFGGAEWNRATAIDLYSFDQSVLDWPEQICVMWDFDQFNTLVPGILKHYPMVCEQDSMEKLQGEVLKQHVLPSGRVQQKYDLYRKLLKTSGKVVGVHVRETEESSSSRPTPTLMAYVEAAKVFFRSDKDIKTVFLATDNRDVQDLFIREFGPENVLFTDKWFSAPGEALHLKNDCPDRLLSAVDAVVDTLLLASADYLVTMSNSSFSMLARMFSSVSKDNLQILRGRNKLSVRVAHRVRQIFKTT